VYPSYPLKSRLYNHPGQVTLPLAPSVPSVGPPRRRRVRTASRRPTAQTPLLQFAVHTTNRQQIEVLKSEHVAVRETATGD